MSVLEAAIAKWKSIDLFKDIVMSVYEVKETFPTMFFVQEVVKVYKLRNDCVTSTYWWVKDQTQSHQTAFENLQKGLGSGNNDEKAKADALKCLYELLEE